MTNICLITTTINVPRVLRLYRAAAAQVTFIVAGDNKTPDAEVRALCAELGNALYLSAEDQRGLEYECSELIGWNCIMRRSIALLEALKLRPRPQVIVTIDDDNIPVEPRFYFPAFEMHLTHPFTGLAASGAERLFNVGELFDPPIVHRGFPAGRPGHPTRMGYAIDAPVGVVAGMWLGDPDINAVERLAKAPDVKSVGDVLRTGVLVAPGTFAPFNSQNTGYTYELAPLMAILPHVGRYDDIWAAYIAERIMWEHDQHVLFGQPFTYQERNPHDLTRDLSNEVYGMRYTPRFLADLRAMDLGTGAPVEMLARLWEQAQALEYLPERLRAFGLAWMRDLERVL